MPADGDVDRLAVGAPVKDRFGRLFAVAEGGGGETVIVVRGVAGRSAAFGRDGPEAHVANAPGVVGGIVAEVGDRPSVGRPRHVVLGTLGETFQLPGLASQVDAEELVVGGFKLGAPVVAMGDDKFLGVGRPVEAVPVDGRLVVHEGGFARGYVDHVHGVALVHEVAVAVEPVPDRVDHARRGASPALLTRLGASLGPIRMRGAEGEGDLLAVGRPLEAADRTLVELGDGACLATGGGDDEQLRLLALTAADEGDVGSVGRPAAMPGTALALRPLLDLAFEVDGE